MIDRLIVGLIGLDCKQVPDDMLHSGAEYEAGWLVVRGRWFELQQRSPRGYSLTTAERIVVVNTMIRLPIAIFTGCVWGKAPREPRSGLYKTEEDAYNLLLQSA